jgi:DNA-binding XRE family transcriptional regulator
MNCDYEKGSGNVFKDLGYRNPELCLKRAEAARQINITVEKRKLTRIDAAKILGITPYTMSLIEKGIVHNFPWIKLKGYFKKLQETV